MLAPAAAGGNGREILAFAAAWLESTLGVDVRRIGPLPDPAFACGAVRRKYISALTLRDAPLGALMRSTDVRQLDAKGGDYCASCAILMRDAVTAARRSTRFDRSGGVT